MFSLTPIAGRENDAKHVPNEQEEKMAPKDATVLKEPAQQVAQNGDKVKDAAHRDAEKPAPPVKEEAKQGVPPAPSPTGLNYKQYTYLWI